MTRYSAQIVFRQVSDHKWVGNLLNRAAATDTAYSSRGQDGSNPSMRCTIIQSPDSEHCELLTQGFSVGSRRYSHYANVTDAQNAAIRWAGRRFKIVI